MTFTLPVIIQYPLATVSMEIPPAAQGRESQILVTVHGSGDLTFVVDLGDGTKMTLNSSEGQGREGVIGCDLVKTEDETVDNPKRLCTIRHTYARQGRFGVTLTVSNLVSSVVTAAVAKVEVPISGVAIAMRSPYAVAVGDSVRVAASIETGEDPVFDWDFGDDAAPVTG